MKDCHSTEKLRRGKGWGDFACVSIRYFSRISINTVFCNSIAVAKPAADGVGVRVNFAFAFRNLSEVPLSNHILSEPVRLGHTRHGAPESENMYN